MQKCNREILYLPSKELVGIDFDFPFRFVAEWYDAQADFINELNVLEYDSEPMYSKSVELYEVIPCKKKILLCKETTLSLYGNRIELVRTDEKTVCCFEETAAVTVLGRNKLNIYYGEKIYQIKGGKRFNALKYVHIFHHYKNVVRGDEDGKFLGL